MIGDRIDTDIVGAKTIGAASALVLTGVTDKRDIKKAKIRPDYILRSLSDLLES